MTTVGSTTVYGGQARASDSASLHNDPSLSKPQNGKAANAHAQPQLYVSLDQANIDREKEFFIRIGKGGVLEALQKLDQRLQQVSEIRMFTVCVLKIFSCSLAAIVSYPERYAGMPYGYDRK